MPRSVERRGDEGGWDEGTTTNREVLSLRLGAADGDSAKEVSRGEGGLEEVDEGGGEGEGEGEGGGEQAQQRDLSTRVVTEEALVSVSRAGDPEASNPHLAWSPRTSAGGGARDPARHLPPSPCMAPPVPRAGGGLPLHTLQSPTMHPDTLEPQSPIMHPDTLQPMSEADFSEGSSNTAGTSPSAADLAGRRRSWSSMLRLRGSWSRRSSACSMPGHASPALDSGSSSRRHSPLYPWSSAKAAAVGSGATSPGSPGSGIWGSWLRWHAAAEDVAAPEVPEDESLTWHQEHLDFLSGFFALGQVVCV